MFFPFIFMFVIVEAQSDKRRVFSICGAEISSATVERLRLSWELRVRGSCHFC